MKALHRLTVRAPIPAGLTVLTRLAANLRWAWHPPTQDLFAAADPAAWAEHADPLRLLAEADPARLAALAADPAFVARAEAVGADLDAYLTAPSWVSARRAAGLPVPRGVAYFSMEFGISEVLPIYSGGLGILAGDHLKAASDLGLPLVGVGLLYRHGYFRQSLARDGWQLERYPTSDFGALPLRQLKDDDAPVLISLPFPGGRTLHAHVWVASVGRIPLLLLDTDIEENDEDLRPITDRLYGGDQQHRVRQEILLGVGGVRAVREFSRHAGGFVPNVYHMNEGHAGFLGLERMRELVSQGLDVPTATRAVRASSVFTTHTPVPAGIDRFPSDLVAAYLGDADGESILFPGLRTAELLALGAEDTPGVFNMAHMGFRLSQRSNGVSQLHGEVSREMFRGLWRGFDAPEVPIGAVTNGVHGPTWSSARWSQLAPGGRAYLSEVPDADIWAVRRELRASLIEEVRRRAYASGIARGFGPVELEWTKSVLDPNVLTIGFARRAATYKRLTLMVRDPQRLKRLLLDPVRPVQLIVAGKAHPADDGGKDLIRQIVQFADDPEVRHRIVFLPDYDISMARHLYTGCDVWLNNPVRPMEACGTSGMKSALNGGLNLSILDGWWDEMADGENGWAIPSAGDITDEHRRDDVEASALYELLEGSVVPLFYDGELPAKWVSMVRHTLSVLGPKVEATRMVADYTEQLYAPASIAAAAAAADDFALSRALAEYGERAAKAWPQVRAYDVTSAVDNGSVIVSARVETAGLGDGEVLVQAALGRVGDGDDIADPAFVELVPAGDGVFAATVVPPAGGTLGLAVRVLPRHAGLAQKAELDLVRYAD